MPRKKSNILEKLYTPVGVGAGMITLLSLAYFLGYWICSIDRRLDAMEVAQRHNEEIANLKIEYNRNLMVTREELNNTILQLQNEIHFLKAKNNEK